MCSGDFLRAPSAPGRSGSAGSDTSLSAFAPGLCGFSPGLCGCTLCPCGLPLSSGWRRALLTSHWPWVVCRAARRRVGVLYRRPVSPLSSSRACSGAGSGWHGCWWITVSAVLSEGLAPWRRPLLVRCPLGRHRGGGSPAARGFAGHGDTGLSAAYQLVSITADVHLVKWQSARSGPPGRRVKLAARSSREPRWAATVLLTQSNRPLASSLAAGGVAVG